MSPHIADLTNKLQNLIDNPIKREALQKKAVERIKKYYSWEDVTYFLGDVLKYLNNSAKAAGSRERRTKSKEKTR